MRIGSAMCRGWEKDGECYVQGIGGGWEVLCAGDGRRMGSAMCRGWEEDGEC